MYELCPFCGSDAATCQNATFGVYSCYDCGEWWDEDQLDPQDHRGSRWGQDEDDDER